MSIVRTHVQSLMSSWLLLHDDTHLHFSQHRQSFKNTLKSIVQLFVHKDPPEEAYEAFKQAVILNAVVVDDTIPNDLFLSSIQDKYLRFIDLLPDQFTSKEILEKSMAPV